MSNARISSLQGLAQRRRRLRGVAIDDEEPVLGSDPGEGRHQSLGIRRFAKDDVDARRRDVGVERGLVEDGAAESGRRLVLTGTVDDVGVAGEADLAAADQTGEDLGVDGRAKDPRFRLVFAADGDDEMGNAAETEEHVADVDSPLDGFLEPRLVAVVAMLEGVGTLVGEVLSVGVDEAEVDEAGLSLVEDAEDVPQLAGRGQVVEGLGVGDHLEGGDSARREKAGWRWIGSRRGCAAETAGSAPRSRRSRDRWRHR